MDRKSIEKGLYKLVFLGFVEVVYVLLWQFFKDDLTKFIKSHVKNIHSYMICLLIEKGICLTGNVCILSKLVILLHHKKAYFFQQ